MSLTLLFIKTCMENQSENRNRKNGRISCFFACQINIIIKDMMKESLEQRVYGTVCTKLSLQSMYKERIYVFTPRRGVPKGFLSDPAWIQLEPWISQQISSLLCNYWASLLHFIIIVQLPPSVSIWLHYCCVAPSWKGLWHFTQPRKMGVKMLKLYKVIHLLQWNNTWK